MGKIDISVCGKARPDLSDLFHQHLLNKKVENESYYWDDDESYWDMVMRFQNDNWDEWDDDCVVYPLYPNTVNGKRKKKRKKCKNGKKSVLDYDDEELRDIYGFKAIYFYYDYHDMDEYTEFSSLKDFSDFCDCMGYSLGDEMIDKMIYTYESHCCVNPETLLYESGCEIVCGKSYSDMFYMVCPLYQFSRKS